MVMFCTMKHAADTTRQQQSTAGPLYTTAAINYPAPGATAHLGPAPGAGPHAEFLRLPKPGTLDPIYGLCRSTWNNLILPCAANNFKPPIKSVALRKMGVRLIVAAAAQTYFDALIAEANKEGDRS